MRILITVLVLIAPNFTSAADRPNIIFMLADDQGWNGLSVAMHPTVAGSKGDIFYTPNLEKFAGQGMRFSAAYAPAPVCSPTRISLQTGKSPAQLRWTKAAPAVEGQKLIEPRIIKDISANEKQWAKCCVVQAMRLHILENGTSVVVAQASMVMTNMMETQEMNRLTSSLIPILLIFLGWQKSGNFHGEKQES